MKVTRQALEPDRIGLFDVNFETGSAYWSRELRCILGVPNDVPAAFGLLLQCIHPDDRRDFAAVAARTFQPDCPSYSEIVLRILHSDDQVHQVHIKSATVFRDAAGRDALRVVGLVIELGLVQNPPKHASPAVELLRPSLAG